MRLLFDHGVFTMQVVGGISRYYVETIKRLAREPDLSIRVAAAFSVNRYLPELDRRLVRGFAIPPWRRTRRLRTLASAACTAAVAARFAPDLIHETYYGSRWPRLGRAPTVLTVYDMIHEQFVQQAPAARRSGFRRDIALKRSAIRRADLLLCISEHTRRDLLELFDLPAARTVVTHLAVDESFATAAVGPSPRAAPYLLFVGSRDWYKDFSVLARAVAADARLRRDFELVCFGGGPFSADERELLGRLGLAGRAVQLGGSDRQLLALYRHARAFVFPSRYEGFGLPLLEAMAAGCPVVASRASCFPEIAGDAAEYFEPESAEDCGRAIGAAVYDEPRRGRLIELGRARCALFTWDKTAQATLAAYRSLLRERGRP
jgi:glycosyltransferase involved in cell wall biosynthesis